MADTKKSQAQKLLQKSCPELFQCHKLINFQFFNCPVTIAEADVDEYILEEYESVELVVLQLVDAGISNAGMICTLTGLDKKTVSRILENEIFAYGHIARNGRTLTELGRKTIEENSNSNGEQLIQHAIYHVKREIQIEAITGSIIPTRFEIRKNKMKEMIRSNNRIMPRNTVEIDEELNREISQRLEDYRHQGIIHDGNTVKGFSNIYSKELRYRQAYLAEFEGFLYPLVIIYGRREIEGSTDTEPAYIPSSIPVSTADLLRSEGLPVTSYFVRDDRYFEYLLEHKGEADDKGEEVFIVADNEEEGTELEDGGGNYAVNVAGNS